MPGFTLRIGLILIAVLFVVGSASAGTLYGTVTEVEDGDTITIICLNRPLRVRLMGIDAPDKDQAHAEVARQHLSDLIFQKFVGVQYSSLGSNALIIGKVFLKEMDVGAQMIRDGVAWFDKNYDTSLTEDERQVYAASEVAARNEQRGIWQDKNPVAPWEFREAQRRGQLEKSKSGLRMPGAAKLNASPGLTSDGLFRSFSGPTDSMSLSSLASAPASSGNDPWIRLTPPVTKFSMMVPNEGIQRSLTMPSANGGEAEFHIYMGRDEKAGYFVLSFSGPATRAPNARILDLGITSFTAGIQAEWAKRDQVFECDPKLDREFSVSGYDARQYDLTTCTVPGRVRFYTRGDGGVRELLLSGAFFFSPQGDLSADKFFNSFSVTMAKVNSPN